VDQELVSDLNVSIIPIWWHDWCLCMMLRWVHWKRLLVQIETGAIGMEQKGNLTIS